MKLRIENNDAKEVLFGEQYKTPVQIGEWIQLSLELEKQKHSNWCWASIGSCLVSYYQNSTATQEEIAFQNFNQKKRKLDSKENTDQNIDQRLDEILKLTGCFSHWSLGKPSFDRIQSSINNGHPVCVRIQWYKGGAHYVVIKGYNKNNTALKIDDPLIGEYQSSYNDFPKAYRNGGAVWTETYWTKK